MIFKRIIPDAYYLFSSMQWAFMHGQHFNNSRNSVWFNTNRI